MWQTTVILLPGVGGPGSFLDGVTSIPLDPVDPLENSQRAPMFVREKKNEQYKK